ncbi:MAG TPA: hypothetical protein PLY87_05610 [Planctomycetaceae bacterium]|nr:hypothetical protein [Planctomycetaceae bacterium]
MPPSDTFPDRPFDLSHLYLQLCDTLESGNFIYLLAGAGMLLFVSDKAAQFCPRVRPWSLKLGVIAFIAWWIRDLRLNGIWGAEQFAGTTLRAIVVMLYAVAVSLLLSTVVLSLYESLLGDQWRQRKKTFNDWWLGKRKPATTLRQPQPATSRITEKPTPPQPTVEEIAERKRLESEARARESARYDLQLFYDKHRQNLSSHISEEKFLAYFNSYITPTLPLAEYQNRIRQLKTMLETHVDPRMKRQRPEFESVEEVVAYYSLQKQKLQYVELDADVLETLECDLLEAQDNAIRSSLQ